MLPSVSLIFPGPALRITARTPEVLFHISREILGGATQGLSDDGFLIY
jgi:hypothetical protein